MGVFERFTERARAVPVFAQQEARGLRHSYIGDEHLLLGLLRQEEGLAARALESLDVTVERVRDQVVRIEGRGEEATPGKIPFTARAKKVLERSLQEALSLGHNHIDTEHLLLGLLREREGVAAQVLLDLAGDIQRIRDEVLRMLPGPSKISPWREGRLPRRSPDALGYPIEVNLAPQVGLVLMAAAARALDDGRTETQPRDLLLALVRDEEVADLLSQLGVDEASIRRAISASDVPPESPAESADG